MKNPIKSLLNLRTKQPQLPRQICLGGMPFEEKSLFTNLIAFGAIGSGKTPAVIYPIIDQICGLYKDEDPTSPTAKWGGLILDVCGDFHEVLIYTMQKSGRDTLNDLVVVRPDNNYYIVEFEDILTQAHFMVAATGSIQSQECDKVLKGAQGPESVLLKDAERLFIHTPNGDRENLKSYLFNDHANFLRPEIHHALKQLEFDVQGQSIRWLGWREENGELIRVIHTKHKVIQYALDKNGNEIYQPKPTRLKYVGVHSIHNGLTYNLIPKTSPSTAAAGRIMAVAEVTGNSMGGDNAYWSNASEKHIAACIELKRQVEGPMGSECSIQDIQKFTTNDQVLCQMVEKLKAIIRTQQDQGINSQELLLLLNLEKYFAQEWLLHDPKTKGNIMSCVTNLFGDVTRNPQLIKTFCTPSTFSFEDCLNDGKVYTLILNAYPNAQQLIGTCMKLDFQQTVLKRTTATTVNKDRFLMFLADEYQFFITTSGGGKAVGDDKFLSVSRQCRIFNMFCTQAISSLLAVQKDVHKINVFLQCIGGRIFLQNLDDNTNKHAEMLLGQVHIEKVSHSGADLKLSSLLGESQPNHTEKANRFEESHFDQMAPFEAVIFNKERSQGPKVLEANLKESARFWNREMMAEVANDYYQAYLENRAFELGISYLFDTANNTRPNNCRELLHRQKQTIKSWENGQLVLAPDTMKTSELELPENPKTTTKAERPKR